MDEYEEYTVREYKGTMLHKYSFYGDINSIKRFLSIRLCEINTRNKCGETALHIVLRNISLSKDKEEIDKYKECYYYLVSKGASMDISDEEGISPRMIYDKVF